MSRFEFREFAVDDAGCGMKICSDSVLLAAWFLEAYPQAQSVVDVGAGSGVLSLFAAAICHDAQIFALEIDPAACTAANLNAAASQWKDRIEVIEGDFSNFTPDGKDIDLIISNPPYFTNGVHASAESRATARHQEGLTYASLIEKAAQWLTDEGHLGLVCPVEFAPGIIYNAELKHLKLRRRSNVRTTSHKSATRVLLDFSPCDGEYVEEELVLRDSDGTYSTPYRQLVGKYYIKMN